MGNLEKEALGACTVALKEYGFALKRQGLYLQSTPNKAVAGWLGLNLATRDLPAKLLVNPAVGVRHVPLEKALVALAGWKPPVASISRPLGYFMPQNGFRQWEFHSTWDLAIVADDLAMSVATYGQPFIDKWSNWEIFSADVAESGLLTDNEKFMIMPIVAALNGDQALARRLVEQELGRVGDASDAYSRNYREFSEGFVQEFLH